MTELNEVKPCPWCGSTTPPIQVLTDGYKWGALSCSDCGATAPEVRTGYAEDVLWYDAALEAWNKRPEDVRREAVLRQLAAEAQKHDMGYPGGSQDMDKNPVGVD